MLLDHCSSRAVWFGATCRQISIDLENFLFFFLVVLFVFMLFSPLQKGGKDRPAERVRPPSPLGVGGKPLCLLLP